MSRPGMDNRSGEQGGFCRICGRVLLLSGAVLVFAACIFFIFRWKEEVRTEQYCDEILADLELLIPERTAGAGSILEGEEQPAVLEVDGISCTGILEIMSAEVRLPVAGGYEDMTYMPGYIGNEEEGNSQFVIWDAKAAPQFDDIGIEYEGSSVTYTDVRGRVYEYKITAVVTGYWSGAGGGDLVLITEKQPTGQRVEIHCAQDYGYEDTGE